MENILIKVKTNKFIDREKALEILQNETGGFESTSRLREDILDAMVDFALQLPQQEISDEEIEKAFIFYFGKNTVVKYRIWTLAINWYREQLKQGTNG